ncbi:uncharacterized protein LOC114312557 [Camellia sinensis]|uniref:uncharacterized protein LOC114312557 n=1 Tax=Camellia sinensis TaxID=4442 RepID=UPI001036BD54|nr:uncharacterized protein LOC114312557 [Camellia sinensis]
MAVCVAKERKILVAVDEGQESMYALSWCLNNILVSHNSKDTLILLYAKPPRPVYTGIDGTGRPKLEATDTYKLLEPSKLTAQRSNRVCNALALFQVNISAIIVLPPHVTAFFTVTPFKHVAFLGSVSNHCAQKANCPVLIVKRPKSIAHDE